MANNAQDNINGGRRLLEHNNAIALAYRDGYDAIKYQLISPIKPVTFETHKNKWQFVELYKHFNDQKSGTKIWVTETEFVDFLTFVYGEGYHEPDPFWIGYINDVRTDTGLSELYHQHCLERQVRYDTLQNSLAHMRATYTINTLAQFKDFISTGIADYHTPPMWNSAIGHSPHVRADRKYSLSLQSFILLDSYLHLFDQWDDQLKGEPEWDHHAKRIKTYRKLYANLVPINSILVRKAINSTMKLK